VVTQLRNHINELYQPDHEVPFDSDPVLTASSSLGRRLATMGEASKRVRLSAEEEIERYLATPAMGMEDDANDFDVLLWWKRHACIFPGLSRVAKAFLCISPTSSPSERAFRSGRTSLLSAGIN